MEKENKEKSEQTIIITRLLQMKYGSERGWLTRAAQALGLSPPALADILAERYKYGERFFERMKTIFPDFIPLPEYKTQQVAEQFASYGRGSIMTFRMRDTGLTGLGILQGDLLTIDLARKPEDGNIVFAQADMNIVVRKISGTMLVSVSETINERYLLANVNVIGVITGISRTFI